MISLSSDDMGEAEVRVGKRPTQASSPAQCLTIIKGQACRSPFPRLCSVMADALERFLSRAEVTFTPLGRPPQPEASAVALSSVSPLSLCHCPRTLSSERSDNEYRNWCTAGRRRTSVLGLPSEPSPSPTSPLLLSSSQCGALPSNAP